MSQSRSNLLNICRLQTPILWLLLCCNPLAYAQDHFAAHWKFNGTAVEEPGYRASHGVNNPALLQHPDGYTWSKNLQPLTDLMVESFVDFLPRQDFPIRTGVHPNTAFGIAFALDYATTTGSDEFVALLRKTALKYYQDDKNGPLLWEPGGEDFFSPVLMEADLMTRVMAPKH